MRVNESGSGTSQIISNNQASSSSSSTNKIVPNRDPRDGSRQESGGTGLAKAMALAAAINASHVKSEQPGSIPTLGSSVTRMRMGDNDSALGPAVSGLPSSGNNSAAQMYPLQPKVEPAPAPQQPTTISVMTSDKRVYSKKVLESSGMVDFSLPPPGMATGGAMTMPPPGMGMPPPPFAGPPPSMVHPLSMPPPGLHLLPPPALGHHHHLGAPPGGEFGAYGAPPPAPGIGGPPPPLMPEVDDPESHFDDYYAGYEPTQESQWAAPPPAGLKPQSSGDALPPGDSGYEDRRDVWKSSSQRDSQGTSKRSSSTAGTAAEQQSSSSEAHSSSRQQPSDRKRRRSRSPSGRYGKEHKMDRDHRHSAVDDHEGSRSSRRDRERDRDRDRDRDSSRTTASSSRRDRRSSRSKSKSPTASGSSSRHKKSKKDRKDRSEQRVEVKREIKEEPPE